MNISYKQYRCSQSDQFMSCKTMLNSEKAALHKVEAIYQKLKENSVKGQKISKYIDKDFGPSRPSDLEGSRKAMYKASVTPKGYPDPVECDWVYA